MMSTLQPRSHAERLRFNLNEVRDQLEATVKVLAPEEMDLAPNFDQGMKTFKQLLQEIGTMEAMCYDMVVNPNTARTQNDDNQEWERHWNKLEKDNIEEMLTALAAIRAETVAYLNTCTEEELQAPIALPESWYGYFGGAHQIEPEELFQWILRHEYYHLGQLITYQWLRGVKP